MRSADIENSIERALKNARQFADPYTHWILNDLLPLDILQRLSNLAFGAPDLDGVSGKRELHNDQRHYFDEKNRASISDINDVAAAFQAPKTAAFIADFFKIDLRDTFLRIEYAVDRTGFWLQPHTDLGVKRLTILHYISDDPGQDDLGTDIYNADKSWAKRTPFEQNLALAFVPGDATYHGFEQRAVAGVRKSLIINYVTQDWRDREQLCFPDNTIVY